MNRGTAGTRQTIPPGRRALAERGHRRPARDLGPRPGHLPDGYPAEYERQDVLLDGRRVFIRPILPGDGPELADAIRTADADTLHRRFMGGAPRVTPALLEHLTVVDYVRRFALVAIDAGSGQGVAVARYEPAGDGVAEVAIAVRPEWRQAGLGTLLILLLAKAAAERGVHTLSASYLAQNRPVAALVEDAGALGRQVIRQGIAEVSMPLDQEQQPSNAVRGYSRVPGDGADCAPRPPGRAPVAGTRASARPGPHARPSATAAHRTRRIANLRSVREPGPAQSQRHQNAHQMVIA